MQWLHFLGPQNQLLYWRLKPRLLERLDSLNNISAVHLRAKGYGLAKEAAANAIQIDPNNMKALCRAVSNQQQILSYAYFNHIFKHILS